MPNEAVLEQRLEALEQAVAEVQRRLAEQPAANNWLDRVRGSISDEPAFLEAMELGRSFRYAGRSPEGMDEPEEKP